jgi:hypothetical protein
MSIDLSQPRVFAFEVGGRKYTLTTKPVTKAMWLKYFSGIVSTEETTPSGDRASSYDSSGARLELLESALIDAKGYTPDDTPIGTVDGWPAKLPIAHRKAAADLLVAVEPVKPSDLSDDALPTLGFETVTLKSTWTANDQGRMQEVTGLVHVFHSPTADHQKRYSRAMSRSIVIGGSRTGQTRFLGAQDVLVQIYDELIDHTLGYTFGSEGFDPATQMDSYHKVAAVSALFTPVEVAEA